MKQSKKDFGLVHDHQRAILIDDEVKTKNPKGQHHRGSAPKDSITAVRLRAPTRAR